PTLPPITGVPFHIASETVRPNPSRRDFCSTTVARVCRALTSALSSPAGQNENALIATSAERFVDLFAFGIIGGKVAEQHQRRVQFFARTLECFQDADWIFPRIETRNLHHQWQICRYVIMGESFVGFPISQFAVLD